MKEARRGLFFVAVLPLFILWGQSSVVDGKTVYSNNFNSGNASLSDFIVAGKGPYSVDVASGQLRINTSTPTPSKGYAAIHASKFSAPYSSTLKHNLGLVSWSFNVSNEDGTFNNSFFFSLASDAPDSQVYTSTSYVFKGGGYVGDRMMLHCHSGPGPVKSIIDITNGMPNLPYKGSFRITYDPSTGRWSLYGICRGSSYFDPKSVSKLLGSNVDDTYTGLDLPYMCIGGSTTGSDYFDNVTVSVFPEPPVGLEIIGPNNVAENSSAIYKAIAYYENNNTWDVTDLVLWTVEPTMVASIEAGVLTTKDIAEGQSATIQVSYTQGDVTMESQKAIHIFALVGIEISGPDEVAENFSAGYQAIAYYDNDSTKDVTDSAFWVVEPNMIASIEAGVLTTKDIAEGQSATIRAGYTEGETTFEAEKAIDIFTICLTGTALQFDGVDDYVDCGSDPSLDVTELTWSLWIKRAETTCTNERALISNEGGGENKNGTYALQIDVGGQYQDKIQFVRHGDDVKNCPLSETAIQDTNWHHVAVTRKINRDVMIYIDGMLDASGTIGTRTEFTKTVIGAGHTSYSNFNGTIDEVMIFNRALSAEEIWANMHMRLVGDEPNLIAYWDFDEGQGQIVYDLSGNGNDGQLGSTADVDEDDPAWIKSDAPIGRCTPYLIATGTAKEALRHKRTSLQDLEAALAKEWTAYEALEQWLESGDYGDLSKGDIINSRQRIHSAIQHEEQSMDALEKGIEKLEDALSEMGYEFIPPNVNITYPLDGAELSCYQNIEIEAHAWDVDGAVVKVEFFADGSKIGEDSDGADGWTTNWYNHSEGTYSLTARVMDDDEAMTTSPAVTITLLETPGQATNPSPADGATGVSRNADLSWTAGFNAVSHDVYFGTTSPGTFRGNQTAATFDPGKMTYNTTYYWRIDEVNTNGTTAGTIWTFKTAGGPPPPPPPPPPPM